MAGGRPPKYKPEFAEQAAKLCELGATDDVLADFFKVSVRTIPRWMAQHKEFCHAVKNAKDVADDMVERSLFQRAMGYEQDAVKIFMPAGSKTPVYAEYRENVNPDTTAAIFWLKNRRKDEWRDRSSFEHTGKDDGPIEVNDTESARRVAFMLGKAVGKKSAKADLQREDTE